MSKRNSRKLLSGSYNIMADNKAKSKSVYRRDLTVLVNCVDKIVEIDMYNYSSKADLDEVWAIFSKAPGDEEWHLAGFQASRPTIMGYYGLLLDGWKLKKAIDRIPVKNALEKAILHKELPEVIEVAVDAIKEFGGDL